MYLSLIVDKLFKVTRQVSITLGVAGLKLVDHPKLVYLMLKPEHSDKQILILRKCALSQQFCTLTNIHAIHFCSHCRFVLFINHMLFKEPMNH